MQNLLKDPQSLFFFHLLKMPGQQGGVSHSGLAICIKKYLKEKEELWKLKYFIIQKYNLKKTL
jgi:hypothetical protein